MPEERRPSLTQSRGPITVAIPASIANDLDQLNRGLANLAERLGHTACLSGAHCFFQISKEALVINPRTLKIEVAEIEARD